MNIVYQYASAEANKEKADHSRLTKNLCGVTVEVDTRSLGEKIFGKIRWAVMNSEERANTLEGLLDVVFQDYEKALGEVDELENEVNRAENYGRL